MKGNVLLSRLLKVKNGSKQTTKRCLDYLDPEDGCQQYLPKRRQLFTNKHGVVSQNVWTFNNHFTNKYLGSEIQRVQTRHL